MENCKEKELNVKIPYSRIWALNGVLNLVDNGLDTPNVTNSWAHILAIHFESLLFSV